MSAKHNYPEWFSELPEGRGVRDAAKKMAMRILPETVEEVSGSEFSEFLEYKETFQDWLLIDDEEEDGYKDVSDVSNAHENEAEEGDQSAKKTVWGIFVKKLRDAYSEYWEAKVELDLRPGTYERASVQRKQIESLREAGAAMIAAIRGLSPATRRTLAVAGFNPNVTKDLCMKASGIFGGRTLDEVVNDIKMLDEILGESYEDPFVVLDRLLDELVGWKREWYKSRSACEAVLECLEDSGGRPTKHAEIILVDRLSMLFRYFHLRILESAPDIFDPPDEYVDSVRGKGSPGPDHRKAIKRCERRMHDHLPEFISLVFRIFDIPVPHSRIAQLSAEALQRERIDGTNGEGPRLVRTERPSSD